MAHGNGRFVAVGTSGTILVSTNGFNWQSHPSDTNLTFNTVAFAQGQFLIGGNRGTILYSADGERWTNATVPLPHDVTAIGFGSTTNYPAGRYLAASITNSVFGRQAHILTSSNGTAWEMSYRYNGTDNFPFNSAFTSIATGGQRVVVSGPFGEIGAVVIRSSDTFNWANVAVQRGPTTFGDGKFVMAGVFRGGETGLLLEGIVSSNTVSWSGSSGPDGGWPSRALCFGGGRFVAVGDRGSVGVSTNGTNWLAYSVETDANFHSVVYGTGMYVAVGRAGTIFSSVDGLVWTEQSGRFSRNLNAVASDAEGLVAVGSGGLIARSADGVHWEQFKAPVTNELFGVTKVAASYLAVGASGTILSGEQITNLISRPAGTTATLRAIASGNGTLVAIGHGGTILTSTDASNWTIRNSGTQADLRDIVYARGKFVAVGLGGTILSSFDAMQWHLRDSQTARSLHRVTHGEGRFVAACFSAAFGNIPLAVTSVDGDNWQLAQNSLTGAECGAYGNGVFVLLSGISSFLYHSTTGTNWDAMIMQPEDFPALVTDLTFHNGTFLGVGALGHIWQSEPVVRLDVSRGPPVHLTVEGPRNRSYRVEATEALEGTNSWQEVTIISPPARSWTDPDSAGRSARTYRAVLLPED